MTAHTWSGPLDAALRQISEGDRIGGLHAITEPFRSAGPGRAQELAEELRSELARRAEDADAIGRAVRALVRDAGSLTALTESGIPTSHSLLAEVASRIGHKLLSDADERRDVRYIVHQIFDGRADHGWLEAIEPRTFSGLLDQLGFDAPLLGAGSTDVTTAVRMLTLHASSIGLHPDVTRRVLPVAGVSPFLVLSRDVLGYADALEDPTTTTSHVGLERALTAIDRCRQEVERVRGTKALFGTSVHLTTVTFRLIYILDRLESLLRLTAPTGDAIRRALSTLTREIVHAEATRNHVLPVIRQRADLVALATVEHAARAGGKYVATSRRDYARFLTSSLAGGLIVAAFALVKTLLEQLPFPLGVQAIVYGLNYTVCFVLIYLTGSTLATKQPAMTANTVAQVLGRSRNRGLGELVELVVRVSRSQFVSLVGNVTMAIPASIGLTLLYTFVQGGPVIGGAGATGYLAGLHPTRSGALAFAAVAGVCLFLAGLISGWVDNRARLRRIAVRVATAPLLLRTIGAVRAERIAHFLQRNLGILAGNTFLGFALGSMGTLGEIFGLPLDIRHVAFASAQFGTALATLDFELSMAIALAVTAGVALIGLVNFVVSFGLSMVIALESRQITRREVQLLGFLLLQAFARRPQDWFFPPRSSNDLQHTG